MVDMMAGIEIFRCRGMVFVIEGVDNDEFDFHTVGDDIFDIDTGLLSGTDVIFHFGKTG